MINWKPKKKTSQKNYKKNHSAINKKFSKDSAASLKEYVAFVINKNLLKALS